MQNPLKAETFTVFGPGNKAKEYVDYLRKLIRNELWDYDSQFNDYVIYPHQFSTLHFYAEFNRF